MRILVACLVMLGCTPPAETPKPSPASAPSASVPPTEASASVPPKEDDLDPNPPAIGSGGELSGPGSLGGSPPKTPRSRVSFSSAGAIDSFLAKNRWRFRACYGKALAATPSLEGSVKLEIKVAADGKVTSSTALGGTVPEPLRDCAVAAPYAIPIPEGYAGTYTFSVHFELDDKK